ncbi:MAG: hypothetical protein RMJ67_01395 [Elusimicrobiota bacterium]|nr:hypothetical protein [Endomicrobiia bacterium]MDW8165159.1 hypothetical protein [Elusimicrobiota bacterium]
MKRFEVFENEKKILLYLAQNREILKFLVGIDFSDVLTPDGNFLLKKLLYEDEDIKEFLNGDIFNTISFDEFRNYFKKLVKSSFYRTIVKQYKENNLRDFEKIVFRYLFLYKIFDRIGVSIYFEEKLDSEHYNIVYYTKEIEEKNLQTIQKYPTVFSLEDLILYIIFYKIPNKNNILVILDRTTIEDTSKIVSIFPEVKFYYL